MVKRGVKIAYLITDSDDTAKDMYTKCGFTKVWQKTILFFKL
jgi:spore maturation protein CgeE